MSAGQRDHATHRVNDAEWHRPPSSSSRVIDKAYLPMPGGGRVEMLTARTLVGAQRIVDMLIGEQLPASTDGCFAASPNEPSAMNCQLWSALVSSDGRAVRPAARAAGQTQSRIAGSSSPCSRVYWRARSRVSTMFWRRLAARELRRDPDETNLIVAHLGNGASITAVSGGRSVDTSMGTTPLEGLVMGTRSGDVDPALAQHLRRVAGLSADEIDDALNRQSGLLALAGANDMREVHRRADAGGEDAMLALEVYSYRLRKYVGAYYAALGRVDAVVFTAGVGENDPAVRARALAELEPLGIDIDPARNAAPSRDARPISPDSSAVAVLVVPTNEELEIAHQALTVARQRP